MRRCWLVLAGYALAGSSFTAPAAAHAAPISGCTSTVGTIIAVDFAAWGGPVVRGCDREDPETGARLLTDEGFTLAGDQHDGPAFVCRIGNAAWHGGAQYPTPAQDPCIVTPPASAYWSSWLAAPGANSWTYSQWGAYAPQQPPVPGGVELWTFSGTRIEGSAGNPVDGFPSCPPDSLRAGGSPSRCTPGAGTGGGSGSRSHPSPGRGGRGGAASASSGSGPRSSAGPPLGAAPDRLRARAGPRHRRDPVHPRVRSVTSSRRTATTPAPAGSRSAARGRSTVPARGSAIIVAAQPSARTEPPSGLPVSGEVGLGLAAALLAAAGIAARRRRRPGR